jgi:hypothetical protein
MTEGWLVGNVIWMTRIWRAMTRGVVPPPGSLTFADLPAKGEVKERRSAHQFPLPNAGRVDAGAVAKADGWGVTLFTPPEPFCFAATVRPPRKEEVKEGAVDFAPSPSRMT